jgi:predicted DNA-binding transcriptional regulator YafY
MRNARLTGERFEPREGFEPHPFARARNARILYSERVARWEVEKGAQALTSGKAVREARVGSDWLVSEIFFHRGEAVVLEPEDLRGLVAERARALAVELATPAARA